MGGMCLKLYTWYASALWPGDLLTRRLRYDLVKTRAHPHTIDVVGLHAV